MAEPIEVTTKYVTTVDSLPEAWAFVMGRLDGLAGEPSIKINPVWSSRDDYAAARFEVTVSAMHEEEPPTEGETDVPHHH